MAGGQRLGLPSACLECCFRKKLVLEHLDEIFSLILSKFTNSGIGQQGWSSLPVGSEIHEGKTEMETVDYRVARSRASSIQQLQDLIDLFPQKPRGPNVIEEIWMCSLASTRKARPAGFTRWEASSRSG